LRCYVLVGGPRDTLASAERRLRQTLAAGFIPMAMLWRDRDGMPARDWQRFARSWARPAAIFAATRGL
jgi:hypothetical protein